MIRHFFWGFVNTGGGSLVSFMATLLIARVATPGDFGLIAISASVILLANVVSEAGLASTIIYDDKLNDETLSTIFWTCTCLSVLSYLIICFSTPTIVDFFGNDALAILLPFMALSCIASAIGAVNSALITRSLRFQEKAILSLAANSASAAIGVGLSHLVDPLTGLCAMFALTPTFLTILLWFYAPWRLLLVCNLRLLKSGVSFAANVTLTNLVDQCFKSSIPLLIGQRYDATTLGYYSRADSVKNLVGQSLEKIIHKVSFPLLSHYRRDDRRMMWFRHSIITQVLIIVLGPTVWFIHDHSSQLVTLLFGNGWEKSGEILRILVFSALYLPLISLNLTLMKSLGKTLFPLLLKVAACFVVFVILGDLAKVSFGSALIGLVLLLSGKYMLSLIGLYFIDGFPFFHHIYSIVKSSTILFIIMVVYESFLVFSFQSPFVSLVLSLIALAGLIVISLVLLFFLKKYEKKSC